MLKNAETFEIMRPEDVGLSETNLVMGKHSGRAALRSKLEDLGYVLADNQLKDVFVRFKELADRKKEVYDEDLIALMRAGEDAENDHITLKSLRVVCGTGEPQTAEMTLVIGGKKYQQPPQATDPLTQLQRGKGALRTQSPFAVVPSSRSDRRHRRPSHRQRPHGRGR